MKYSFGAQVKYRALDDKVYPALVLGRHNVPAEGDYSIAYQPINNETVVTYCWEERLSQEQHTMLDLLEKERDRAKKIAYALMHKHKEKHDTLKSLDNPMAFVEEKIADECRIIGNAINGGDALSVALGETMRDRIAKEYFATTVKEQ